MVERRSFLLGLGLAAVAGAPVVQSEADAALQRALPLLGGEFDTDISDQISPVEAVQTDQEVSDRMPFRLERA